MRWLKWILAYLFDCVHPHTTWPHQNRSGFAYVCCVDCGRELPYSLELMRILDYDSNNDHEFRNPLSGRWPANASL
jgi:hypothetical protein